MCCSFLFRHYFVWKAPVGTLVPMNRRVTVKHTLAILCELSDPFKGCWWPPTGGSKSHGLNHLVYGIKCHLSNGHHERQSPNASHLTSHGFPPIFRWTKISQKPLGHQSSIDNFRKNPLLLRFSKAVLFFFGQALHYLQFATRWVFQINSLSWRGDPHASKCCCQLFLVKLSTNFLGILRWISCEKCIHKSIMTPVSSLMGDSRWFVSAARGAR